ncbi:hypothetical protein CTI12_AA311450 [Artemisia annua]|uniref:LRAT domain-containing protein n=1 Tax=Artemisia annua TaxID=35608 RepID=A0A2U1N348_ARTAN|nr:hypothetical protein CTI12_AA311450 [Artemisia annua]
MGYFSHRVDRSDIKEGDHIYTWRNGFLYSHHGIYVGEQKVVHFIGQDKASFGSGFRWNSSSRFSSSHSSLSAFLNSNSGCSLSKSVENTSGSSRTSLGSFCSSSNPSRPALCLGLPECGFQQPGTGVLISCLNCFLDTGSLYRFQYGVWKITYVSKLRGGTCTTAESDPPEEVIDRALYLFHNGFGRYDVVKNNCEDFALYCKTGLMIRGKPTTGSSGQVNAVCNAELCKVIFLTAAVANIVSNLAVVPGAGFVAVVACRNRYKTDIGVRDDVEKVDVEEAVEFRKRDI